MGHIGRHEVDAGLLQTQEEVRVTTKTIQLRDHKPGAVNTASLQSLCQSGAVGVLAALDLGELGRELPLTAVQVVLDSLALRIK
jgi:hypothetical protein